MSRDRPVVGVFGGSFDPIHLGHLRIAAAVRTALGLDALDLLLSPRPPHKVASVLTGVETRAEMIRLAIQEWPGLCLSTREFEQRGPSYTIDTLRRYRTDAQPSDPVFIMGADSLYQLESWHLAQDLLREFDFVVIDRPGSSIVHPPSGASAALASRIVPLVPVPPAAGTRGPRPGSGGRIFTLSLPLMPESSTEVRKRVSSGQPLDDLVSPAVAGYISRLGLYRGGKDAE